MLPEPDHNCYLPTREQIEAACSEIQSRWSSETEAERRCGSDPAAVPVYSVRHGRHDELLAELVETAQ